MPPAGNPSAASAARLVGFFTPFSLLKDAAHVRLNYLAFTRPHSPTLPSLLSSHLHHTSSLLPSCVSRPLCNVRGRSNHNPKTNHNHRGAYAGNGHGGKPPQTTLAPISGLHNSRCGRLATSRACASLQKRRLHRFQGSTTLVAAVWQLRERVQAARNDACTDFRAPQLSLRPFGNFASMCKPPETTLALISGLHNSRCGRLATSRACASLQKRRLHRFQGSTTLVAAVWQLRERVQASRNDACTDFRAPQLSLRPFGNFASMCKPPETTLALISGLHNSRCGRLATSRACASLQKRRLH